MIKIVATRFMRGLLPLHVILCASKKLSLDDPVSKEEVKAAINQIPSDKALGLDGFTVLSSRDVGAQSKSV
jgi:hypothetical protein